MIPEVKKRSYYHKMYIPNAARRRAKRTIRTSACEKERAKPTYS